MEAALVHDVPSHVPDALVREWELGLHVPTDEDPFAEVIPRLHEGPRAIFALRSNQLGSPSWVFRRDEDIRAIYLDTETFSSHASSRVSWTIGEDWDLIPVEIDPPRHRAYRSLLNPLFLPKRMALFEEQVRSAARHFVDQIVEKGECDFIADFALPFPITVFLGLMDLPIDGMDRFVGYEQDFLHDPDVAVKSRAMIAITTLLKEAMADRRRRPGDDFISFLVAAEIDGRKLTESEILATAVNFYLGGLDTVTSLMGWQFRHLAQHQDDQARLRGEPDLLPKGLEELIRAFAPVSTHRLCTREVEFGGVTIMPGDLVMVSTPLAGRDPEMYDRPNEIQLSRGNSRHMTFAFGPHHCIGAHLARRELSVALEEVLPRFRNFRLKSDAVPRWHYGAILGLETLPLEWDS